MLKKLSVSDIGILALVIIAIYAVVTRSKVPAQPEPTYRIGQEISDLKIKVDKTTLILVTSEGCSHCVNTLPAYRNLVTQAHLRGVLVIAVSNDDLGSHRQWLEKNGIVPDEVVEYRSTGLKIIGTPTTIVLGAPNKVMVFEIGELDNEKVNAILKII